MRSALVVFRPVLGPVDPSFRALSGRRKFTVRRHKFNKDILSAFVSKASEYATCFKQLVSAGLAELTELARRSVCAAGECKRRVVFMSALSCVRARERVLH